MGMPFAPCSDVACADDTSVEALRYIFGPVIDGLLNSGGTSDIAASANILATMFGVYASGIMIVSGFIVSAVIFGSVINTANDGEVMGKAWSTPNTIMRIVSGGGVLIATPSGFSSIQLIVLVLALWGVGFANFTYKTGMAMGVLSPAGIVSNAATPGSYYGMRDFAKQYMGAMYCARVANATYKMASGATPKVVMNGGSGATIGNRVEYSYNISDTNPETNLAGGSPVCGVVKLSLYGSAGEGDDTERALNALRASVQKQKYDETQAMMADLKSYVDTWPSSIDQEGWANVDSSKFNEIVKKHEDQVAVKIMASLTQQQGAIDKGMEKFVTETLVKGGWASAGGWFQRVGMARGALASIFSESVGSVGLPTLTGLPSSEQTRIFISSVNVIPDIITAKAGEKLSGEATAAIAAAGMADLVPSDLTDSVNIKSIEAGFGESVSSFVNEIMRTVVATATGAGNNGTVPLCGSAGEIGGSINRMKCIGDYMAATDAIIKTVSFSIQSSATIGRIAAGVGSTKVLGTGADLSSIATAINDWINKVPLEILATMSEYFWTLAFYFGVIIPSFPNTVFMIVVVGWLLAVLQTIVAAPLWAVMHMTPDRTFIGSQTQGYLMLLALFVRPTLAVIGLFASMLISDPIITYIAKAFFDMHSVIAASTGLVGAIASFRTFFWWLLVFGGTLMPVLWMTYGLPQTLPDEVLRWISAGIGDLGASNAIPEVRGGHRNAHDVITDPRRKASGRQQITDGNRGGGTPSDGDRGRGRGPRPSLLSQNDQGVTP